VHNTILEATRSLLVETGYAKLTTDRVANRAGVGKQTVYRRWPSKAPLVAEAVLDSAGTADWQVLNDTGGILVDLQAWMRDVNEFCSVAENTLLLRALTAAACENPMDSDDLYSQLTGPQYEAVLSRLHAAVEAGQLRADVDMRGIADAMVGAVFYRALARPDEHQSVPDSLLDVLIAGAATATAPRCRDQRDHQDELM
jgi:AcrR family transcriptional regulator